MEITKQQLENIIDEAKQAANVAAKDYFNKELGGKDQYACGFAWVAIYKHDGKQIKGNTKIGRLLKECGVTQNYERVFHIWNPSGMGVQNVDTLYAGAKAAAEVFKKYGFDAHGASRLD